LIRVGPANRSSIQLEYSICRSFDANGGDSISPIIVLVFCAAVSHCASSEGVLKSRIGNPISALKFLVAIGNEGRSSLRCRKTGSYSFRSPVAMRSCFKVPVTSMVAVRVGCRLSERSDENRPNEAIPLINMNGCSDS
jgi:hypothetical protein